MPSVIGFEIHAAQSSQLRLLCMSQGQHLRLWKSVASTTTPMIVRHKICGLMATSIGRMLAMRSMLLNIAQSESSMTTKQK